MAPALARTPRARAAGWREPARGGAKGEAVVVAFRRKLVGVVAVARVDGDADGRTHLDLVFVQRGRCRHGGDDAPRQVRGVLRRALADGDDDKTKLVGDVFPKAA